MTTTQIYKMSISYLLNPEPEETSPQTTFNDLPSDIVNMIYTHVDDMYLQEHQTLFKNQISTPLMEKVVEFWDMKLYKKIINVYISLL